MVSQFSIICNNSWLYIQAKHAVIIPVPLAAVRMASMLVISPIASKTSVRSASTSSIIKAQELRVEPTINMLVTMAHAQKKKAIA